MSLRSIARSDALIPAGPAPTISTSKTSAREPLPTDLILDDERLATQHRKHIALRTNRGTGRTAHAGVRINVGMLRTRPMGVDGSLLGGLFRPPFPGHEFLRDQPGRVPAPREVQEAELSKEDLIAFWKSVIRRVSFNVRTGEKMRPTTISTNRFSS